MAQANQEPSMEDILASIKRIIAEDSESAGARPPARGRKSPVAVVPDPAPPPAPEPDLPVAEQAVAEPEPLHAAVAEPAPYAASADVLELTSPLIETDEEEPAMPAPKAAPQTMTAPEPAVDQGATAEAAAGILSAPAEAASRTAFAALTQLQVRTDSGQSNTLEGLVADLLRPMLRDWLDRELPALVERLVEAEIKRVSGRG
jgi:uncharacterized protein